LNRPHPANQIETDYSILIGEFMTLMGIEYVKAVRAAMAHKARGDIRTNADFSLMNVLTEIRAKMKTSALYGKLLESVPGVLGKISGLITDQITSAYRKRNFPIPEMYLKTDPTGLAVAIQKNVDLIGAIVDKQSDLLERAVIDAVHSGSDFDTVVQAVQDQSDRGLSYAQFVARDQIGKAYADISQERQKQSGIERYEWVATDDSRTRPSHLEQDGKVFSWGNPPLIEGRPLNPGEDYQCRCIALPVFD